MSHPVPGQPSHAGAARDDVPSAAPADRPLPDFQPIAPSPHSPIDREIERSQRASAALAATRALARASFTDSQLAADDAAGRPDEVDEFDAPPWIRTEYAPLDHAARATPDDDVSRHLVGGSFNPGIASQQGRAFPSASITNAAIRTRTGAQARFLQESRQTPRPERPATRIDPPRAAGARHDNAAVMLSRASSAAPRRDKPLTFLLAVGLVAVLVLLGGGFAWRAGVPSSSVVGDTSAARAPAAARPPIERALAADVVPTRTSAELDAALAAAARAAAVPAASVRAAGPAPVVRSTLRAVATPVPAATPPQRPSGLGKEDVAAAIANAQARSDKFLSSEDGTGTTAPAVKRDD